MTKHHSQQSGGRHDWLMTPLKTSKFHTDTLFAQHSLSSSCLWAFMNYEIKRVLLVVFYIELLHSKLRIQNFRQFKIL